MSFDVVDFNLWAGLLHFLQVFCGIAVVFLVAGFLISLIQHGAGGVAGFLKGLTEFATDFARTSPQRIWAICLLTWKEATRRKALYVFVIFALLIMFAGWFLRNAVDRVRDELAA